MVKYCVLDLLKCAPEFREAGNAVEVKLEPSFYRQVKLLMPEAEASQPEKQILNQDMYERAQKKHKNFLRRQRAKQAKQQQKKEQEEQAKLETSSDSGVSTKSDQKPAKKQATAVAAPKVQVIVTPPKNTTEVRVNSSNQPKQPTMGSFKNNFQNQGKLRASSDEDSLNGESKMGMGQVFIAQPVKTNGGSRSWANSRLKRQRSRIGSRS